ncbi:hypothetical protein BEP19_15740 [Ammoniphilus oxalaticus]|uniref:HTH cro/C1-type domain-containing protein n=1 Tax=Ammoniphilus oxalaticus TaxID=66863 RepID=A0A419SE13_9BACL|nr:helix-turn-helix transcriptional regulator [Ammoniphilus oxalaticus]RKD21123.1 hypothetical protein BEP19_15740 [Ammoniphilus oxalaticus]
MVNITLKNREKVLLLIAKEGVNLSQFAKEIGISNSYLSVLLNGRRNPSINTASKLAERLGVDIESIFSLRVDESLKEVN